MEISGRLEKVKDFYIASCPDSDSSPGDSGGPWWVETHDHCYLVGVHRAKVRTYAEVALDPGQEGVAAGSVISGRTFVGATGVSTLLSDLEDLGIRWRK